uniref:Uncharacterized protein n=1 Tax=Oncorhynchus kisutch TaxID=8019 RepID=A0A8C7D1S3_ONCKI
MSWFFHVNQGSNQQPPGMMPPAAGTLSTTATLKMLQVKDCPPNIFECQLRLWTQWFESWSEEERNSFLHILEERDRSLLSAGMEGYGRRDALTLK